MKYFAPLLLIGCLLVVTLRAQEPTGIRFFNGSWQEVLAESRRQHKPVFVDFYTSWCPPCRRMALEAFPNAAVGAKFNEQFINYQVNAEAGDGIALAKQFAVASYPTALYLIPTGELVHRGVGYGGVQAMLKQADMVLGLPPVRRFRRKRPASNVPMAPALPTLVDSAKALPVSTRSEKVSFVRTTPSIPATVRLLPGMVMPSHWPRLVA